MREKGCWLEMNVSDVIIVSGPDRGLDLAVHLARDGHRVSFVEVQGLARGPEIQDEDLWGPFHRFVGSDARDRLQASDQPERDQSAVEFNNHFEILLPSGPVSLGGRWQVASKLYLNSLGPVQRERFDALLNELFSLGRGRMRSLAGVIASRPLLSDSELSGKRREVRILAEDLGVRLICATRIEEVRIRSESVDRLSVKLAPSLQPGDPVQTERARLVVWMLSRSETLSCSDAPLFDRLFEASGVDPLYYWWRNRLLWKAERKTALPRSFGVVGDLLRPHSHHNLLVCNVLEPSSMHPRPDDVLMDVWSLLPHWSATDAAYRDEHRLLSLSTLSSRFVVAGSESMHWLNPSPLALSSERLEVLHSVEGGEKKKPKPRLSNVICFGPESLDWIGNLGFELQRDFYIQSIREQMRLLSARSNLKATLGEVHL